MPSKSTATQVVKTTKKTKTTTKIKTKTKKKRGNPNRCPSCGRFL